MIKKDTINKSKAFPLGQPPKSLSSGFTLIEVLIAMGILTTTLFLITNLQSRALNKILLDRDRIEHLFLIKREFATNFIKPPNDGKKVTNTIEDPKDTDKNVKLVTYTQNIQEKSQLKDFKKYIKFLKTDATWKKDGDKRELSMMSLVYKPVKKEKDKK